MEAMTLSCLYFFLLFHFFMCVWSRGCRCHEIPGPVRLNWANWEIHHWIVSIYFSGFGSGPKITWHARVTRVLGSLHRGIVSGVGFFSKYWPAFFKGEILPPTPPKPQCSYSWNVFFNCQNLSWNLQWCKQLSGGGLHFPQSLTQYISQ